MANRTDYYDYWGTHRKKKKRLIDRERISFKFISSVIEDNNRFLDLGCGGGDFMKLLGEEFPRSKLKGIDYSKKEVSTARKEGLDVSWGDFEKRIDIKSSSVDVVYAGEVIEHLYNPDLFLSEINRVLKNRGYLVLSTPNLCAWFNRVFMPLGIQPLFLEPSTKSKLVGAGPLKSFKKEPNPVGHVRIFTVAALKDLFEMNGFKILKIKGALYEEGLPKWMLAIDSLFSFYPGLSAQVVILARKEGNVA